MSHTQKNSVLKFILTVFFCVAFFAPLTQSLVVHAAPATGASTNVTGLDDATDIGNGYSANNAGVSIGGLDEASDIGQTGGSSAQAPASAAANPAPVATPAVAAAKNSENTSSWTIVDAILYLPKKIGAWFGNQILSLTALITYLAGETLNYTLNTLVYDMGKLVNSPGLGSAIDQVWKMVRDIANLIFIFAFVYVGIYLIIDPEKSSIKGMLARTIIGALLINFSLFFVKFVIDIANFTTLQIYTTLAGGTGSISDKIADMLGITGLFNAPDPSKFAQITGGDAVWFFILSGLLLLVVAFVFFVGAFMMITRFVGLVIIMIASPLLFAGTVFPGMQGIATDIWKKLIAYAFYAPAFLLLIFISIKLIEPLSSIKMDGKGLGDVLTGNVIPGTSDTFAIFVNFFIIIFFFIQALHLADKMGLKGADMAVKVAGGLTVGLTARMGRATVGQLAHRWSEDENLKDKASQGGVGGWAARQRLKVYRSAGDASFDLRNTDTNKNLKLGLGEGRKGGYATVKKETEAKEMKFAKSLGEIDDKDARVAQRKQEMENAQRELKHNKDESKKEALEANARKAENNYNKEKNRRVLGGTYTESETNLAVASAETKEKEARERLSRLQERRVAETDTAEIRKLDDEIKTQAETIQKAKKDIAYFASQPTNLDGYANVLKESTRMKTWVQGRLLSHEKAAGEAMEKAFTKKIKKTKEEKAQDALIDAVKESKGESK